MSVRSFTKIWLHLIWNTYDREKVLIDKTFRKEISSHLYNYSKSKNIMMINNYVNTEHVHALINMPTNYGLEELMKLLKGESSHWINQKVNFKFSWGKGYGAFSVSQSNLERVVHYIKNQETHHETKSFKTEYEELLTKLKINQ